METELMTQVMGCSWEPSEYKRLQTSFCSGFPLFTQNHLPGIIVCGFTCKMGHTTAHSLYWVLYGNGQYDH